MKKFSVMDLGLLLIWALPAIYLLNSYNQLPNEVPTHYDISGKANGYSSKNTFLIIELLLMGVAGFTYFLVRFIPVFDPKKQAKYSDTTYYKLAAGLVVFLTAMSLIIIYAALNNGFKIENFLLPIISLLFVFIGNLMNSIKPNYFAGIRTPWTLESEDNWRATHRLAGKLWVIGGIILTFCLIFLPTNIKNIVFMIAIGAFVLVPIAYSFYHFKQKQQ